jgi:hypothetical protein
MAMAELRLGTMSPSQQAANGKHNPLARFPPRSFPLRAVFGTTSLAANIFLHLAVSLT